MEKLKKRKTGKIKEGNYLFIFWDRWINVIFQRLFGDTADSVLLTLWLIIYLSLFSFFLFLFFRAHLLEGNLRKRRRLLGLKGEQPKTSRTTTRRMWIDIKNVCLNVMPGEQDKIPTCDNPFFTLFLLMPKASSPPPVPAHPPPPPAASKSYPHAFAKGESGWPKLTRRGGLTPSKNDVELSMVISSISRRTSGCLKVAFWFGCKFRVLNVRASEYTKYYVF